MEYKKLNINNISKFSLNEYFNNKNSSLSSFFWSSIFDSIFFSEFIENKYIPFLKERWLKEANSDFNFLISSLARIKKNIDIKSNKNIEVQYLFFSYIIFNKVLEIYNNFYKASSIKITLNKWVIYEYISSEDISETYTDVKNRYLNWKNLFLNDFIYSFLNKQFKNNDDKLCFSINIFWPWEIIWAIIISNFLKSKYYSVKIILDLSDSNEQVDFKQWKNLILWNTNFFTNNFDFFIFYKDFWFSKNLIFKIINWKLKQEKLYNIIENNNWKIIEYPLFKEKNNIILEKFVAYIQNKNTSLLFWKRAIYLRMFPYKCYWNKCHFCTINSQNFLIYDDKYNYDFFIENLITKIKTDNIFSIVFSDEAMPPLQIIKFAKKIIENKLNIIFQFRTRFDNAYTEKNCEILYKWWARYCGIGLESASERINEEIWNKWERDISVNSKIKIIENFDKSWITFHNYSIIWFPTEKLSETIMTYNFWLKSIKKSNFYTVTPNVFWLMKWSYIYNNPEKYWINILKSWNFLDLNYEFSYKTGKQRDLKIYKQIAEKIHKNQFTPWLLGSDYNDATWFWNYIDRSSYFYKLKVRNKVSPFINYFNINKKILDKKLSEILNCKFKLSIGIEINEKDNSIYDWVNLQWLSLDKQHLNLIKKFSDDLTLLDNFNKNKIINYDEEKIFFMIKNRILTIKQ